MSDSTGGELEASAVRLAERLTSPGFVGLAAGLMDRYAEAHRRYHTTAHLRSVLRAARELDAHVDPAVELAVWYHDAVYDPSSDDNEERSAELAAEELKSIGLSGAVLDDVTSLVLATKHHDASVHPGAAVLLDADLSVLGADVDAYEQYRLGVREEFGHVSDDLWAIGRRSVLEMFVQRDTIFVTSRGIDRWEQTARRNVAKEIAELT